MARPLRIEFAGAFYHVISRGDRREAIYVDGADRESLLEVLSEVCERFRWTCHAYCLMASERGHDSRWLAQNNGVRVPSKHHGM